MEAGVGVFTRELWLVGVETKSARKQTVLCLCTPCQGNHLGNQSYSTNYRNIAFFGRYSLLITLPKKEIADHNKTERRFRFRFGIMKRVLIRCSREALGI